MLLLLLPIVLASWEYASNHPSATTAALGCTALPQYTCFNNSRHSMGRFATGPDPGNCCALCRQHTACASFNHVVCDLRDDGNCLQSHFCELYTTVGDSVSLSDGGCVGGAVVPQGQPPPPPRGDRPNIVWLVVESTDGRTWSPGYQNGVLALPNIRKLQQGGLEFRKHYANAPVCCPSRATFWSGRHASNIPHDQKSSRLPVGGAWNNFEGLPSNYSDRIDQVCSIPTLLTPNSTLNSTQPPQPQPCSPFLTPNS